WLQNLQKPIDPFSWLNNLNEPWMRKLITEFITSGNSNSVWHNGKDDNTVSISTDLGDYSMGCRMPIVDIPYKSTSKDKISGPDCIFGENVETSCRQDHRNGGELVCSPNHSKPHIFSSEREDSEIFLRGNNSLRDSRSETDERTDIRNEQTSCNDKSKNDANIVFECSNHEKIKELQSSLGKLFRDSTLVCSTWTKKTAETPCHLVLPNDELKNKEDSFSVCPVSDGAEFDKSSCINSPILVEILRESDSCRVATSLCLDLQTEDPEENTKIELQCYITDVKQFGFNHIIIIGKRYCGMLFMDCFGRMFDWDSDSHALWSLGDYFDIISKEESEKNYDDRTAWDVLKDGTVFVLHK
ncbi:23968_t:CDS:2, partial [Dentiscutata erythropus]